MNKRRFPRNYLFMSCASKGMNFTGLSFRERATWCMSTTISLLYHPIPLVSLLYLLAVVKVSGKSKKPRLSGTGSFYMPRTSLQPLQIADFFSPLILVIYLRRLAGCLEIFIFLCIVEFSQTTKNFIYSGVKEYIDCKEGP